MPFITIIKCDHCDLSLPTGAGGYMYVLDSARTRVTCPHPAEMETVNRVTGLQWHEARTQGLLGFVSHCICFACTEQFDLDVERDVKRCPNCASLNVKTANASIGSQCPKCHPGKLIEQALSVS